MKYLLSILLISCVSAIVAVDIDLSEVVLSDKSTVAMEKFRASMLEENDIYNFLNICRNKKKKYLKLESQNT